MEHWDKMGWDNIYLRRAKKKFRIFVAKQLVFTFLYPKKWNWKSLVFDLSFYLKELKLHKNFDILRKVVGFSKKKQDIFVLKKAKEK